MSEQHLHTKMHVHSAHTQTQMHVLYALKCMLDMHTHYSNACRTSFFTKKVMSMLHDAYTLQYNYSWFLVLSPVMLTVMRGRVQHGRHGHPAHGALVQSVMVGDDNAGE